MGVEEGPEGGQIRLRQEGEERVVGWQRPTSLPGLGPKSVLVLDCRAQVLEPARYHLSTEIHLRPSFSRGLLIVLRRLCD